MKWTNEEIEWLKDNYPLKGRVFCAEYLKRGLGAVRQKASDLKLKMDHNSDFVKEWQSRAASSKIGKERPQHSLLMAEYFANKRMNTDHLHTEEQKEKTKTAVKESFAKNGHPKGFLGGVHGEESLALMSKAAKSQWESKTKKELKERTLKSRLTLVKNKTIRNSETMHTRGVGGKRPDLDNQYFRSKAEANFARYLKFKNKEYEYEKKHFFFDGLRKGAVSYTPDFYIPSEDSFVEFKGWLCPKSVTKLKRFKKYYPVEFAKLTIVKQGLGKKDYEILTKIGFTPERILSFREAELQAHAIPFWEF